MTIKVGDTIPDVQVQKMEDAGVQSLTTSQIFNGRKVILFALPGAFTPTCSEQHVPSYISLADKLKAEGIDEIICLSVNDAFVMDAWKKTYNAEELTFVADGGAELTEALGLEMDTGTFGGVRSQRYAMMVDNGVVKILQLEKPSTYDVSSAEAMLRSIKELS